MTALYMQLVEKILQKETIPSGKEGYYFAVAHDIIWWEYLDQLAEVLHASGITADTKTEIWPSDAAAAEVLGLPIPFVRILWKSGSVLSLQGVMKNSQLIKILGRTSLLRTRINSGGNRRGTKNGS
jgi:hypothetical protein